MLQDEDIEQIKKETGCTSSVILLAVVNGVQS